MKGRAPKVSCLSQKVGGKTWRPFWRGAKNAQFHSTKHLSQKAKLVLYSEEKKNAQSKADNTSMGELLPSKANPAQAQTLHYGASP